MASPTPRSGWHSSRAEPSFNGPCVQRAGQQAATGSLEVMTLAVSQRPLCEEFDVALLDLDGVVYLSHAAIPGAVEALSAARDSGMKLAYLTNNASRTAETVAGHLRDLGLSGVTAGDVVTSAQAIASVVAAEVPTGARVLVVGGEGLRVALHTHGLTCVDTVDDEPVAVVQGYSPEVGWLQLAEASYAIESGMPWFVSNTDLTIPTSRGIAPGNGALVNAVRAATGVEPVVAGKPCAPLFEETLARIAPRAPLMVGDRLDTDIAGARNVGITSLMVLTGVNSLADAAVAPAEHRPDFIARDLSGLTEPQPPVEIGVDAAVCGRARVHLEQGRITPDDTGVSTDLLRAALGLAWSLQDASETVVDFDERLWA